MIVYRTARIENCIVPAYNGAILGEEECGMLDTSISASAWDGQFPPHVARNEQIWWEVFPHVRTLVPHKVLTLLGGAKEHPPREIVGKVICVADTKAYLRRNYGTLGSSLLNHWGCYCQKMMDEQDTVYTAQTMTEPHLTFKVWAQPILIVSMRFVGRIAPGVTDALQVLEQRHVETFKKLDSEPDLEESEVSIMKFNRGSWENGLDMAFKAAIWVRTNPEEALAHIWQIKPK